MYAHRLKKIAEADPEEGELSPATLRESISTGMRRGAAARLAYKHPGLFLAANVFLGDTAKTAELRLNLLAEELQKMARQATGGWEQGNGGSAQAYSMTPKSLGISGGNRLGGMSTFSELASMSMRPSLANPMGAYGGWSQGNDVNALMANYKNMANGGGGAIGWLCAWRAALQPVGARPGATDSSWGG